MSEVKDGVSYIADKMGIVSPRIDQSLSQMIIVFVGQGLLDAFYNSW